MAEKTGILNLTDLDVKSNSSIWMKLLEPALIERLRTIDISNNQLKVLPLEVYGLHQLKTFVCNNSNLQSIQDMTSLIRLTHLKLQHNDLEEHKLAPLPPTITHLYLSYNHFKIPPSLLFLLPSVIHLDLSGNRLVTVEGIDTMTSLVEINLDDNLLQELPVNFGRLIHLKYLSLKMNQLRFHAPNHSSAASTMPSPSAPQQSIPKTIFEDTKLEKLELKGNPITNREVMAFEGIDRFMERRKAVKDRAFQGGGYQDHSLFGLD